MSTYAFRQTTSVEQLIDKLQAELNYLKRTCNGHKSREEYGRALGLTNKVQDRLDDVIKAIKEASDDSSESS